MLFASILSHSVFSPLICLWFLGVVLVLASTSYLGFLAQQVGLAQNLPPNTPLVIGDKAYRGLFGITSPLPATEVPAASPARLDTSVLKTAAGQRVEGLNHGLKSWKVASLTFRATNPSLHSECVIEAALLHDSVHHLRKH